MDVSSESELATAKVVFSTVASVAATVMLAPSPRACSLTISSTTSPSSSTASSPASPPSSPSSSRSTMALSATKSTMLRKPSDKISPTTRRLRVAKPKGENNLNISMEPHDEVADTFGGAKLRWVMVSRRIKTSVRASRVRSWTTEEDPGATESEVRFFKLSFHRWHKDTVLGTYLPYVVEEAKWTRQDKKTLKLFTPQGNIYGGILSNAWTALNLDHPATFETFAVEAATKEFIMEDLRRFVERREYYRKVGKAWKRGYLLYGPPGTGKSNLVAAMANYLKFDIYDLELTELTRNAELRKLLVAMANRSILVVEDLDCTIGIHGGMARVTNPSPFKAQENSEKILATPCDSTVEK